jgi:hypothetical protein
VVLEGLLHLVAELPKLRGRTIVHHDVAEEQVHVLRHVPQNAQAATAREHVSAGTELTLRQCGTHDVVNSTKSTVILTS